MYFYEILNELNPIYTENLRENPQLFRFQFGYIEIDKWYKPYELSFNNLYAADSSKMLTVKNEIFH